MNKFEMKKAALEEMNLNFKAFFDAGGSDFVIKDENDNDLYHRTKEGFEAFFEYDKNGNMTLLCTAENESSWKYDDDGYKTHHHYRTYKSLHQVWTWYNSELNAARKHIIDACGNETWREYDEYGKTISWAERIEDIGLCGYKLDRNGIAELYKPTEEELKWEW